MDQVSYEHWQASMTNSSDVFPSARPQPLTLPDGKPAIEAWPLDQSILHLNHGSFGAVPNSTLNAVAKYESQANRAPIGWFPRVGARIRDMRSQHAATIREFQESMSRLGLTAERIGKDFGVSGSRVEQIITLKSGVLEYPWIIRAYLLSKAAAQGMELTPFTALRGNPHDYWFLDGDFIDRGEID